MLGLPDDVFQWERDLEQPLRKGADGQDVLFAQIPTLHLVATLDLLVGHFVLVGNAVVRKRFVEGGGVHRWSHLPTVREFEVAANTVRYKSIVSYRAPEADPQVQERVMQIVGDAWLMTLRRDFPERSFALSVLPATSDGSSELSVYQDFAEGSPLLDLPD